MSQKSEVAVRQQPDKEEDLPFAARMVNHLLTPGSSLTSSVWTAFNIIMIWLFLCWLLFVFSFPESIHVWAFGILGFGLMLSTNWFMKEIFKAGLDFDSTQRREKEEEEAKKKKNEKKASTIKNKGKQEEPRPVDDKKSKEAKPVVKNVEQKKAAAAPTKANAAAAASASSPVTASKAKEGKNKKQ